MYEDHLYWYAAVLNPSKQSPTGVHDADTMNVVVDLGAFTYVHKAIRVANINAPELSTEAGKLAKAWAINWFALNCPGGRFIIHTHLDPSDKYGRFLAMIYSPAGLCFNEDIVKAGMAVPFEVEQY
jgi:endonuclease YncB( thermonuclease family)